MVTTTKGEQTRELILATALRMFREQGYEATTMRAIAREAGVAVGNAYYYFASKEELVQAFYEQLVAQHPDVARPLISGERDLAQRLRLAIRADLPRLLWLFHMSVILYWVHDRSPDAMRTHQLIDRATPLVVKLIGLTRLPGTRGVLDDVAGDVVDLLSDLLVEPSTGADHVDGVARNTDSHRRW